MLRSVATGSSSFTTFLQVAPRLLSVVRHMRPTWHLPSLAAVDAAFVRAHTIGGIIWDVDGVLTGDRRPTLEAEAEGPFRALVAMPDLAHVVLSNAGEERYRQLGEMFPEVPILRGYTLRTETLFRRLHRGRDSWTAAELEHRLASGARVIRKPSAALVDYAVRDLGCEKAAVVMVGDQYLTDVAGANLGGVRSIKLPTLARGTFRWPVRLSQQLEVLLYAVLHR